MAVMIPRQCHGDTPGSERRVFDLLSADPDTESWTVLHSLGLSRRGRQPYGEIDFVVIVPERGLVCLEIKGGRVRCENGEWFTRNRKGEKTRYRRSPFMQAREGMFALREAISKEFGPESPEARIATGFAVVFTDVTSPPHTPEFERWELIDTDDLRRPISQAISRTLTRQGRKVGHTQRPQRSPAGAFKRVRQFLRPDFDLAVALPTTIARSEARRIRLTEDQYENLDLFDRNARCLLEGAAGTGKTMLAIEFARRTAAAGRRTAVLCFNRLLGRWVDRALSDLQVSSLIAGSYHARVRKLIMSTELREEFLETEKALLTADGQNQLLNEVYPLFGQLAAQEDASLIDTLIVDEAQDLIRRETLDVLDKWLQGGLAGGRWVFLGDFTRQALYATDSTTTEPSWAEAILSIYCSHFTRAGLQKNCRNTRPIGEEAGLLSGFESLPYKLDDQEEALPVDYRYWKDRDHERELLEATLHGLIDKGVDRADIVVLSPLSLDRSVAGSITDRTIGVDVIQGLNGPTRGIGFSTIQAFKGLESSVIVLCDVDGVEDDRARSLLYVGMSRARSQLTVLLRDSLRSTVAAAASKKLSGSR